MYNELEQALDNVGKYDPKWQLKYQSVKNFVGMYKRFPSRHHVDEHVLLNWLKYNRRQLRDGALDELKKKLFEDLTAYRHSEENILVLGGAGAAEARPENTKRSTCAPEGQ